MRQVTTVKFAFQGKAPIQGFVVVADRTWATIDGKPKPVDTNVQYFPVVTTHNSIAFEHDDFGFDLDLVPYKAAINALKGSEPVREGKNDKGPWTMSEPVEIDRWSLVRWTSTNKAGEEKVTFQLDPRSMTLPSSTQMA